MASEIIIGIFFFLNILIEYFHPSHSQLKNKSLHVKGHLNNWGLSKQYWWYGIWKRIVFFLSSSNIHNTQGCATSPPTHIAGKPLGMRTLSNQSREAPLEGLRTTVVLQPQTSSIVSRTLTLSAKGFLFHIKIKKNKLLLTINYIIAMEWQKQVERAR